MNAQLFTDAMSELNDKYVMEAVSYQRKSKTQFNTWLSKVACVFLAILLTGSAVLTFSVEARAAFFGWVREQYDNFYVYFFEGGATVSDPVKYLFTPTSMTRLFAFLMIELLTVLIFLLIAQEMKQFL